MLNALLIDDRKPFLQALEDAFLRREFHVTTAISAEQGLNRLNEGFDFICIDYNMPGRSGYEFCAALKTLPEYALFSHIPLIGIGDFPLDKRFYLDACLQKPFAIQNLFDIIEQLYFNGDDLA